MEKVIELTPLAETGRGCVKIKDDSIEIEVSGINGGMKAWLIGGEAVHIGNIVDGKLRRSIDIENHSGVLITQGGRQMLIGKYADEEAEGEIIPQEEKTPFEEGKFNWRKFTGKSFEGLSRELRFIMSNKSVYDNYKKHKHYWVGENNEGGALALKMEETDPDPFEFLGKLKISKNGYVIVCVDKETNKLYIP